MRSGGPVAFVLIFLFVACASLSRSDIPVLDGEKALEHVRRLVSLGPRPPGSEALQKSRDYMKQQLQDFGYRVEEDVFDARTPYGTKRMINMIARIIWAMPRFSHCVVAVG